MPNIERSFIAIKPDAVQRGLTGDIINRYERKGLKLVAMKMLMVTPAMAEEHYREHIGKPFFDNLMEFITSAPVIAMVWEGQDAISVCRMVNGATDPEKAQPGTIRFDYGQIPQRNIVHGSDSVESADREIAIFFKPDEICEWKRSLNKWIVPNTV